MPRYTHYQFPCQRLVAIVERQSLSLTLEHFNVSSSPFPSFVYLIDFMSFHINLSKRHSLIKIIQKMFPAERKRKARQSSNR